MHVVALEQKASEHPDRREIMQEMMNISAFSPTSEAVKDLSDTKCLPVKLPSGEIHWLSKRGSFAIIDRREYGEAFAGRINILDFSLEEVHSIRPFLLALGLEKRYMSRAVTEHTTVQGGSFSQCHSDDLRNKAYAICR